MDFIQITLLDIIDIAVAALLMYWSYRLLRGTHATGIVVGILLIFLAWVVVRALGMELLAAILGAIVGAGPIALIVLFQPEIRRFLHLIGARGQQRSNSFFSNLFTMQEYQNERLEYVHPIVKACTDMSATKTGALIVIRGQGDLEVVAQTGVIIDARVSSSLLKNIFFKNSPLHDGAVLIDKGRIVAAKCVLPTTEREVPDAYGMRHRAALGMSEVSDAMVVVVSEETGGISIFRKGQTLSDLTPAALPAELLTGVQ